MRKTGNCWPRIPWLPFPREKSILSIPTSAIGSLRSSGGFRPVVDREDEWAIRTDDGWLAVLDDSLRIRRQYVTDALIFCFARVGDLSVLYDKELTRLVGSDGKVRAEMKVGVPVSLHAPVLYCRFMGQNSLGETSSLSPSLGRDWNDPDPFEKAFVADSRWNH